MKFTLLTPFTKQIGYGLGQPGTSNLSVREERGV